MPSLITLCHLFEILVYVYFSTVEYLDREL
jgi:hypothetical protein